MLSKEESYIQTFSGKHFHMFRPAMEEICIEDIAHALSNICRYAGHAQCFYSVAEHSIMVSRLVDPELAMWGLLHDAPEAYIGDIPAPIKKWLPEFQALDDSAMELIAKKFELDGVTIPSKVKEADRFALVHEMHGLLNPPPISWKEAGIDRPSKICLVRCYSPEDAFDRFLYRFQEIISLPRVLIPYEEFMGIL